MRVKIGNRWRVEKYRRGEARPYEVAEFSNAVTAAGKDLFLALMAGTSSDRLDNGADLRLKNSGGSTLKTIDAQASGYPQTSEDHSVLKELRFRWEDRAGTAITDVHTLEVLSPAGGIVFSTSAEALGNKPTTEDWIFNYTVTLSTSEENFQDAGMDRALQRLVTNDAGAFDAANTRARIYTSGETLFGTASPTDVAVDTGNDKITWTFEFGTSQGNTTDWSGATMRVVNILDSDAILRSGGTGTSGVKTSDAIWVWPYEFLIT